MGWDGRDARAAALLVVLCGVVFHRQLSFWFTGPDTFSLIRSSQIADLGDLVGLFTHPLMAGTDFTRVALFFRPVTQVSFAVDWALWGMEPFGYHLTNLLLHTTATVLVYTLARKLTGGSRGTAVLAAVLFSVHPVIAESVPAISRRQDALSTVFLLGAFLAYLHAWKGADRAWGWWSASLVFALAAFGSKEVALVLPGVLLVHAWLLDPDAPGGQRSLERARWALERAGPYLAVALGFVAWRSVVLSGLGGYPGRPPLVSRRVAWDLGTYLTALVSPLRYAQVLLGLSGPQLAVFLAALTGALLGLAVALYRGRVRTLLGDLQRAAGTRSGRVVGLCLAWIAGGGAVFALARTFDDWSAYPFVVPLALSTAILLVGGLTRLGKAEEDDEAEDPRVSNRPAVAVGTVLLAASVALALAYSPTLHGYEAWETNGEVKRALLTQLSTSIQEEPSTPSTLRAHNLAWNDGIGQGQLGRANTVFYFQDFTLEDWLVLQCGPACRTDVKISSATTLHERPETVKLRLLDNGDGTAELFLSYEG